MSEFRILHLSDAHIGNPKWTRDEQVMLSPLVDDVRQQAVEFGRPNLVVFSGDLVFGHQDGGPSPLDDQFARADRWLRSLGEALGSDQEPVPLLIVPGNHDVDRDKVSSGDQLFVNQLTIQQVDDLLYKKNNDWKRMVQRLDEWKQFAAVKAVESGVILNPDWLQCHKIVEAGDKKIGIAGLNTSWASYERGERNKLWIGDRQVQEAHGLLADTDFRILVTHHPTSWMNEAESSFLETKIQASFNIHLHGHEHQQWYIDARGHLKIEAGACYQGSTKTASYCWIGVDCQRNSVRLRIRKWENSAGGGGWIAFHIPGKTSQEGEHSTSLPFEQTPSADRTPVQPVPAPPQAPSLINTNVNAASNGFELCRVFRERFGAEWESPDQAESGNVELVYWPVRLRNPNVVHAAQAFIAGGLQRTGAEVNLWLDDYGGVDANATARFKSRVRAWLEKVNANPDAVRIQSMTDLLGTDAGRRIWETLKRWYADPQHHKLLEVFQVAKLLGPELVHSTESLNSLLEKPPKKLLAPPIVWTCLVQTLSRRSAGGVITLGGVDEQPLWNTWRRRISDATREVGHLYVKTLFQGNIPYDMDRASSWTGNHHIGNHLKYEFNALQNSEPEFLRDGGMAHWCFTYCVELPSYLCGNQSPPVWEELKAGGALAVIHDLPLLMEQWIF